MDIKTLEQPLESQLDSDKSEPLKMPIPQWARALVLAALASGCATLSKSDNDTTTAEAASVIEEPIRCTRELKSLHANSLPFSEAPACDHPVPNVVAQTVEFTENIRTQSGKEKSAHNLITTVKPFTASTEFCKATKIDKWIAPSSNQTPDLWPNEELIGLSLDSNDANVGTFDANTLLVNREVRTLAGRGSHLRKILKGFQIEKSPEGVRFKTEIIDCD